MKPLEQFLFAFLVVILSSCVSLVLVFFRLVLSRVAGFPVSGIARESQSRARSFAPGENATDMPRFGAGFLQFRRFAGTEVGQFDRPLVKTAGSVLRGAGRPEFGGGLGAPDYIIGRRERPRSSAG